MNAAILEPPVETPEPSVSCTNCPAVLRLERALKQLQRDFRREVGSWKTQHAKAVRRIEQLTEELEQSRGQVRALPRIPLDNNASERAGRGPAVARKNFYGSGSLWSGRLAATMFSLLATLAHWKINPRLWLTWYLENCDAAGGKAPDDIQPFLPWNFSSERRAALTMPATIPTAPDSS
jgi:hypothetical protein